MESRSKSPTEARHVFADLPQEMTAAWQTPMRALQQSQAEWLDGGRALWSSWLQRRQQAFESGIEALGRIGACGSPSEMSAICDRWVAGSMERLTDDMNEVRDLMARLAEHAQHSMRADFAGGREGTARSAASASPPGSEADATEPRVRARSDGDGSREARARQE